LATGAGNALVAVEHSILGADHFINRIRKSRQTRRLIGQLTQLGYDVTLERRSDG
jgi:transposase